ncbi:MAG: hypothetical protein K2J39_12670 [Ruminococcus sp.]|nr:hypothetical protein [Ruminococcus sp.]
MEKGSVRYELDFRLMPLLAENQGLEFINLVLASRGSIICNVFNSFYDEFGNSSCFKDCPKHFTEDQFTFTEKNFGDNLKIIHVSLPDEHTDSHVYCIAYVFVCRMEKSEIKSCSMYTIEKSMGDIAFICRMNNTGHMNYGFSTGSVNDDIQYIRELATSKQ